MELSICLVCFHPPAFNSTKGRAINSCSESSNNFQCQLKVTAVLSIFTKRLSNSFEIEDCLDGLTETRMRGVCQKDVQNFSFALLLNLPHAYANNPESQKQNPFWDLTCERVLVSIRVTLNVLEVH